MRQGYNKYHEGIPFPLICQPKIAEEDDYKYILVDALYSRYIESSSALPMWGICEYFV